MRRLLPFLHHVHEPVHIVEETCPASSTQMIWPLICSWSFSFFKSIASVVASLKPSFARTPLEA